MRAARGTRARYPARACTGALAGVVTACQRVVAAACAPRAGTTGGRLVECRACAVSARARSPRRSGRPARISPAAAEDPRGSAKRDRAADGWIRTGPRAARARRRGSTRSRRQALVSLRPFCPGTGSERASARASPACETAARSGTEGLVARARRGQAGGVVDDGASGVDRSAGERVGAERQAKGAAGECGSLGPTRARAAAGSGASEDAVPRRRVGAASATARRRRCDCRKKEERRIPRSFSARRDAHTDRAHRARKLGGEQDRKARDALERSPRRIQQRRLRQGQDRDASRQPFDARGRTGGPYRPTIAGGGRPHRRCGTRARRLRRASGRAVSRDARATDLRGCGARLREGQSEEGVQGGTAAGVRRRHECAAVAGARQQAPEGLSLYLGIDLGASNIRSVIARDEEPVPRIVARDERPTPRTGAEDVIAAIADSSRAALASLGLTPRELAGAACSAPGPLNHISGIVYDAPNINGFADVHLAAGLTQALGVAVFLDRDTIMAAIGEGVAGAAKGVRDFVYVTISTGIGGGLVSGGRMLRGVSNIAGEIGHWPVALEGPRCGCGSYGCVESLAAGRFLAEAFGVDDAARVYAAAASGDPRAVAIIARAEAALGNLAITLVNGLNPSLIIIGGSVAEHEPAHTIEPMRRAIDTRAFRVAADAVRLVPPGLGRDVGMLGAVISARERLAGRGDWFL
ncbi:MAG: ROK family protein [Chloroflexi bacterium]|nr:MAG: ROK family protein [Chloroflexota bacterium]